MAKPKTAISLSLFLCFLVSPISFSQTRKPAGRSDDRVIITPRKITFPRAPRLGRIPVNDDDQATITLPVITGLRNKVVLNRIRTALQLKNIFGSTLAEYRKSAWLEELDYTVNYNRHHLLDLTFTEFGFGMHAESNRKHFLFDLRNGNVLKASDVFLAAKLDQLSGLVNEKLQQELKESRQQIVGTDGITDKDLDILYGPLQIKTENLDDFEVTGEGVVFRYDPVLPHVLRALAPVGRYRFTYAELKPYLKTGGPLWQFVD